MRECWYLKSNLHLSSTTPNWTKEPLIYALTIEIITVNPYFQRQGHYKRFIHNMCLDERYEMVVVECVRNKILRDALIRWGWEHDPIVQDYYWKRKK